MEIHQQKKKKRKKKSSHNRTKKLLKKSPESSKNTCKKYAIKIKKTYKRDMRKSVINRLQRCGEYNRKITTKKETKNKQYGVAVW